VAGVAVVTGGSRGIGAACARPGWAVCIGYQRDHEAATSAVDACRTAGVEACAVTALFRGRREVTWRASWNG